jgi:hypothetical protein
MADPKPTPAAIAAEAIEIDVLDRRGLKWELRQCDDAVRKEIRAAWTTIIAKACADACAEERERVTPTPAQLQDGGTLREWQESTRAAVRRAMDAEQERDQLAAELAGIRDGSRFAARIVAFAPGETSGDVAATTSATSSRGDGPKSPALSDRFVRAYVGGDHAVSAVVRDGIARVVAAVRAESPRAAAAAERADVVAWLLTTPRACGHMLSIQSANDIARLAEGIERGDHVGAAAKGGE